MLTTAHLPVSRMLVEAANRAATNRQINLTLHAVCSIIEFSLTEANVHDARLDDAIRVIRAFASDQAVFNQLRVASIQAHAAETELGRNGHCPASYLAGAIWRVASMLGPVPDGDGDYRLLADIVQTIVELVYRAGPSENRSKWCQELTEVAQASLADLAA